MVMARMRAAAIDPAVEETVDPPDPVERPTEETALRRIMRKMPKDPDEQGVNTAPKGPPIDPTWLLCGRCGEKKPPDEYDQDNTKPARGNRRAICKLCRKRIRSLKYAAESAGNNH